jgi:hypothetical protein
MHTQRGAHLRRELSQIAVHMAELLLAGLGLAGSQQPGACTCIEALLGMGGLHQLEQLCCEGKVSSS